MATYTRRVNTHRQNCKADAKPHSGHCDFSDQESLPKAYQFATQVANGTVGQLVKEASKEASLFKSDSEVAPDTKVSGGGKFAELLSKSGAGASTKPNTEDTQEGIFPLEFSKFISDSWMVAVDASCPHSIAGFRAEVDQVAKNYVRLKSDVAGRNDKGSFYLKESPTLNVQIHKQALGLETNNAKHYSDNPKSYMVVLLPMEEAMTELYSKLTLLTLLDGKANVSSQEEIK